MSEFSWSQRTRMDHGIIDSVHQSCWRATGTWRNATWFEKWTSAENFLGQPLSSTPFDHQLSNKVRNNILILKINFFRLYFAKKFYSLKFFIRFYYTFQMLGFVSIASAISNSGWTLNVSSIWHIHQKSIVSRTQRQLCCLEYSMWADALLLWSKHFKH